LVFVEVLNVEVGIHRYIPPNAKIPLVGQYPAFPVGTWFRRASTPVNVTVTVVPVCEQVIVPEFAALFVAVDAPVENAGNVENEPSFP
jgi:hypothetical protein